MPANPSSSTSQSVSPSPNQRSGQQPKQPNPSFPGKQPAQSGGNQPRPQTQPKQGQSPSGSKPQGSNQQNSNQNRSSQGQAGSRTPQGFTNPGGNRAAFRPDVDQEKANSTSERSTDREDL